LCALSKFLNTPCLRLTKFQLDSQIFAKYKSNNRPNIAGLKEKSTRWLYGYKLFLYGRLSMSSAHIKALCVSC